MMNLLERLTGQPSKRTRTSPRHESVSRPGALAHAVPAVLAGTHVQDHVTCAVERCGRTRPKDGTPVDTIVVLPDGHVHVEPALGEDPRLRALADTPIDVADVEARARRAAITAAGAALGRAQREVQTSMASLAAQLEEAQETLAENQKRSSDRVASGEAITAATLSRPAESRGAPEPTSMAPILGCGLVAGAAVMAEAMQFYPIFANFMGIGTERAMAELHRAPALVSLVSAGGLWGLLHIAVGAALRLRVGTASARAQLADLLTVVLAGGAFGAAVVALSAFRETALTSGTERMAAAAHALLVTTAVAPVVAALFGHFAAQLARRREAIERARRLFRIQDSARLEVVENNAELVAQAERSASRLSAKVEGLRGELRRLEAQALAADVARLEEAQLAREDARAWTDSVRSVAATERWAFGVVAGWSGRRHLLEPRTPVRDEPSSIRRLALLRSDSESIAAE